MSTHDDRTAPVAEIMEATDIAVLTYDRAKLRELWPDLGDTDSVRI